MSAFILFPNDDDESRSDGLPTELRMMFSVQVPGVEPGTARVSVGCSTN